MSWAALLERAEAFAVEETTIRELLAERRADGPERSAGDAGGGDPAGDAGGDDPAGDAGEDDRAGEGDARR